MEGRKQRRVKDGCQNSALNNCMLSIKSEAMRRETKVGQVASSLFDRLSLKSSKWKRLTGENILRHPVTAVGDGLEIISIEMGVETIGINVMAQEGNRVEKRRIGRKN